MGDNFLSVEYKLRYDWENEQDMAYIDPRPRTKPSLGNMETEFNAFVEKLPYDECTFTFYQMMDWELTNPIFIYWLPGGVGPEKKASCEQYVADIKKKCHTHYLSRHMRSRNSIIWT